MEDDLDVSEAVILDHITAILYVGWHSTGEGLMDEEDQACVEHFSPYVEWRGMAVEQEFQAVMLAEDQEEIEPMKLEARRPSEGVGDLESLSLQPP